MNHRDVIKDIQAEFAAYKNEAARETLAEKVLLPLAPKRVAAMKNARVSAAKYRYEMAQDTIYRSWHAQLQFPPESITTKVDRINMLMAAREAAQNDPLFTGILRKYEIYTAGTLRYQADTGNDALDEVINQEINETFWYDCDISGRFCFQDLVLLGIREERTVGRCGYVWVQDDDEELRLMLIEGDRIGHPYEVDLTPSYVNGITVDKVGRPVSYRVYRRGTQTALYDNPQEVPAEMFIHYFTPCRYDVYNPVPPLAPIGNLMTDAREILESMRIRVKTSAMQTFFAKTLSGLPQPLDVVNGKNLAGLAGGGQTPGQVIQNAMGLFRFGTPEEDIKEVPSSYPAQQIQDFYENLVIKTAANCLNLSYGLIRDMASLTGPAVRAVLAQDDREFLLRRINLSTKFLRPVVRKRLFHRALRGLIPGANPFDESIYRGKWHFPGSLTIDLGREAQKDVMLNNNALETAEEIYGQDGQDWREGLKQCVKEQQYLEKLCDEAGIDINDVRRVQSTVAGRVTAAPPSPDDQPQGDQGHPAQP